MHRALAIPEIVTLIFQECDHSTLLCSIQRVSRDWHTIIQNSTPLQQKLFFVSLPEDTPPIYNAFLAKKFPAWFPTKHRSYGLTAFTEMEWFKNEEIYGYKNASWRNMLVVQPAATKLLINNTRGGMLGITCRTGTKDVEDGVRMGLLYDYISNHMSRSGENGTFAVDWRGVEQYPWEKREVHYPMDLFDLRELEEEVIDEGGEWNGFVKIACAISSGCCPNNIEYLEGNFLSKGYKELKGIVWGKERSRGW
ncbi:hypothetical protein ACMFMG_001675 [Clarireedia jacksonii]